VSLSDAGATSTPSYTVTLTVGSGLTPPSGLGAQVVEDTLLDVQLTWTDNTTAESGFVVERRLADTWVVVDTVAADITSLLDKDLALGLYTYRVKALGASASSPYSHELAVNVDAPPAVFVTGPAQGAVLMGGTVCPIAWSARKISIVQIQYSVDQGENWVMITPEGGIGTGMATWGNYPWTVPNIDAPSVIVRVSDYGVVELGANSGVFSVTSSSAVAGPRPAASATAGIGSVSLCDAGRGVLVRYVVADAHGASLAVYDLNGNSVAAFEIPATAGHHSVIWHRTTRSGKTVVAGTYVIRMTTGVRGGPSRTRLVTLSR
jgi:hypothetical protein